MATSEAAAASFEAFMARAWADHADAPEAVAQRLRTETPAPTTPAHIAALARLVLHLLGEHLGRFEDGRWRLGSLESHPLALDAAACSELRVGQAALSLAEGPSGAASGCEKCPA